MKKAFGLLELLITIVVLVSLFIFFSNKQSPMQSYVESQSQIKTKQQVINDKLDEINRLRDIRQHQEQNLLEEEQ